VSRRGGFTFGLHARRTRTAVKATAACGGNREPEQGPRSQRRRSAQGAPADAGTATRKTAPQCRNQQSYRLLVSPRESPRGMRRLAGFRGRCPQRVPPWGLTFGLHARRTRTAAKATAACGGNREPEQGQRSQRRRPAQGAHADAGTAPRKTAPQRRGLPGGLCLKRRACNGAAFGL